MMLAIRHAAAIAILILLAGGWVPAGGAGVPGPVALLLAPADLPPGYVRDDALENADARQRAAGSTNSSRNCAVRAGMSCTSSAPTRASRRC